MCFVTNKEPISHIAKKDIRVYKVVKKLDCLSCLSIYQNFQYIKNEIYKQKIIPKHIYTGYEIRDGFHSYTCSFMFSVLYKKLPRNLKLHIGIFIIPKGTKYYVNSRNEVVSEAIIYKE